MRGFEGIRRWVKNGPASWTRTRSWLPSASATTSAEPRPRTNAMDRPSGDQPTGLAMSSSNRFGVPPRNGTRHSAELTLPSSSTRTTSTKPPSGVTVTAGRYVPPRKGPAGTICTLLDVAVWRIHTLASLPSSCEYTTYLPSGEMAGADALPLVVSRTICRSARDADDAGTRGAPRCQSAYTPATTEIATTTAPMVNALQWRLSSPATNCVSEDGDTEDDRTAADSDWT